MSNDDSSPPPPPPPPGDRGDGSPMPHDGWPSSAAPPPPPPPSYGAAHPGPPSGHQPPPSYGQQPPPPSYGQYPPADSTAPGWSSGAMVKAPRPDVKIGAILIIAGSLLSILGVFLPWASGNGENVNGFDDFIFSQEDGLYYAESPGTVAVTVAVVMLALGATLFFAGRVLAVAIIAIVGAVIAIFIGLAMVGIAAGLTDDVASADLAIGAIMQPVAPLLSLAGAIAATAKRRRMVPAGPSTAPFAQPGFGN